MGLIDNLNQIIKMVEQNCELIKEKTEEYSDKCYFLDFYEQQGDEINKLLEYAEENLPDALRDWADKMRKNAKACISLADAIEIEYSNGAIIDLIGEDDSVIFFGDEAALDRLADKGLIKRW